MLILSPFFYFFFINIFQCVNLSFLICFSGNYGPNVTLDKLKDFHRRRLQILVEAGPDLLAFETIPNKLEAQVCLFLFYQFDYCYVFDAYLNVKSDWSYILVFKLTPYYNGLLKKFGTLAC